MRISTTIIGVAGVAIIAAGTSLAAEMMPTVVSAGDSSLGAVLTDASGMTLYTFDKDVAGKSNCYDRCAENWPPLFAAEKAEAVGDFSVIPRDDGTHQWAVRGLPLYLWVKDTKPGETTGHGVGDVWQVARP